MPQRVQTVIQRVRRFLGIYEQASRDHQLSTPPDRIDSRPVIVLIAGAIILSLLNYYGGSGDWDTLAPLFGSTVDVSAIFQHPEYGRLARLTYWSATTVIGYFLIPLLLIRFLFKERLAEFGLPFPGSSTPFGFCLALYLVMLPVVLIASFTDSFQSSYPFYHLADRSVFDFLAWQILYAAQFFALEFFYRGFLLHGLKGRFGAYAILVSMIPYVMIHFGKPMPETLGSIIAGIALGAMSYHLRSIWPGALLHIAIALSMDAFSLSAQGRIGLF